MAAPTITGRQPGPGFPMDAGYQIQISFAVNTAVSFWEKDVTPPGLNGEKAIDTTTQFNTTWRTHAARKLKTLTDGSASVAYDPRALSQTQSMINVNTSVTVHFPDLSTLSFYGYLESFIPESMDEAKHPMAKIKIQPTNWDPTNHVEQGPVYTRPPGTATY